MGAPDTALGEERPELRGVRGQGGRQREDAGVLAMEARTHELGEAESTNAIAHTDVEILDAEEGWAWTA